ncbi:isopenicillin N synthase family oxygenase [Thermobifida halotolerans]|uniref:Isopenicillin N synthase family oxygenase n=1 Tax=Thermobifida halotolerans TaxID=483545 RepID=A0AA97LY88_9ACTN|nr:2-oxoglutarate and iron-dependent oxygenase domain-containing protein [Thermobifida halotolerans]UOE20085.1 isopenicillin N synthase family oxygenase [Thermobifida halotolerans]
MTHSVKTTGRPLHVPVVNISRWEMGSARHRASVAASVDAAATDIGFLQITGHKIPEPIAGGLVRAIDTFFAQSDEAKRALSAPAAWIDRGYRSPSSAPGPRVPESFTVGTQASDHRDLALPSAHYPENIWPSGLPRFRHQLMAWFEAVRQLARRLTRIFAVTLDLPEGFFHTYTGHSLDVLRVDRPPAPTAARTDAGILTVRWADPAPCVQLRDTDGRWRGIVPEPGAILVNVGDLLARWTNDRWVSPVHRIVPSPGGAQERHRSATFFHDGDFDALVTPLPTCVDKERPVKYAPVTVAAHLAERRGWDLTGPAV